MARTARNQKIDTPSARAKLKASKSGYWTAIAPGCSLGYRKGPKGGVWVAKFVRPDFRREAAIGPADDALDADKLTSLDYPTAQRKAATWFTKMVREASGEQPDAAPLTVSVALDDYLAAYRQRGGKAVKDTETRINALIRPQLGAILVEKLTAKRIRDWHAGLAATPARLRTGKLATAQRSRTLDLSDVDSVRQRKATANRTLTTLKAALNHAFKEGKTGSDGEWRRVKPAPEVDAAKVRYIKADETKRLVNATEAAFRPMVLCALLTGCRYGEIVNLRAADFDAEAGTVAVRVSKSGKPRYVVLGEDGRTFFEQVTAGLAGDARIFNRADGGAWGKSHQHRPLRAACEAAKIAPAVSFHILRHTYASHLVMNGAPLQVVAANLGHADTRMTEKHYAHLSGSYVADAIRAAMPKLGLVDRTNVRPIGKAAA